ncbi:hypothetical protein Xcel_3158 [Xylanimonas cellulosilytica DSM 15894]|uniref:Peptidoglycan-binding domain 1 protein n=1 Tax=Xylanimonas cellulosilytica (strain DSM 15894 / JCM 12276 / CECT 5975 / KCTC 9989 / LMG 20990 / NBRC 107835 / XIL07) TaxID=446471 RepID=D1C0F6_XYLCX|nr:hypothetical protein [Xylanimonas cellulosilytica]ACZ32159.1 hypothetical protein Xcel_3158 [Xylanimonas cellulosilytica DSM 15894]
MTVDDVVVTGVTDVTVPDAAEVVGPRGLRGPRLVLVVAGVAVLCLVIGLVAGRFVVSPAQAAAEAAPPTAGPVTAPVEERVLSNDVVLRADAVYADAVDVRLETGEISGPAVVTGQVPDVGTELGPASVLLEIAGRPVIVLPGDLPVYRTLRVGTSGPDVLQLKASLAELGIDAGDVTSDVYDAATAAGADALYAKAGYPSPPPPEEAEAALAAARDAVRAAEAGVRDAENAVAAAGQGVGDVEKLQADNAVRAAERQLAQAQADAAAQEAAQRAAAEAGEPVPPEATVPVDVAGAEDALTLARAERAALDQPRDTSAEQGALTAARQALTDAREDLEEARAQTLTALPASEIIYVSGLPRRVDDVHVERGGLVSGAVASVSGATLMLEASVSASDAELLSEGAVGGLTLSDGSAAQATVVSIGGQKAGNGDDGDGSDGERASSRVTVKLEPTDLTPEQVEALRGENVRVTVSVGATDGEVLAVPIAALTAGSGGESRVEVQRAGGATELVEVTTGLAADGFVEIVSAAGDLAAGAKVVVGR